MTTICPTITAEESHTYRAQFERIESFATRVHLDVADGVLAPRKLIDLDRLWWPGNKVIDLHVMYRRPFEHTELFIVQHPNLVIVHAEAEGNFLQFAEKLHRHGIQVGIALLPDTEVKVIAPAIRAIDHLLIFSGNLGYQGGSQAHLRLLNKAKQARALKPSLEIGWDGGINPENAHQLAQGGIDVLNVGGFLQRAQNPAAAYKKLQQIVT